MGDPQHNQCSIKNNNNINTKFIKDVKEIVSRLTSKPFGKIDALLSLGLHTNIIFYSESNNHSTIFHHLFFSPFIPSCISLSSFPHTDLSLSA